MGGDKQLRLSTNPPKHDPRRKFGCVFCSYRFRNYRQLEEHTHTHTKERPHHCDKCDLYFSALKTLWEHNRVYHLGIKWKCIVCGMEFNTTSGLSSHKKTHGDAGWWAKILKEYEEKEKRISSSTSTTTVWKAISNNEEEKTEMKEVREEEAPPKKKIKLVLKKEIKAVGEKLMRTVHPDVNADSTNIATSEIISLENTPELPAPEVKINKKEKRKWECEFCKKRFRRPDSYSLKRHMRSLHRDVPNLTSLPCYLNPKPLLESISSSSSSSSPSKDNEKDTSVFSRNPKNAKLLNSKNRNRLRNLQRRKKVASSKQLGDPCPFCNVKFTRLDSVYRHIERFHSEEQEDKKRDSLRKPVQQDEEDHEKEEEEEEEAEDNTGEEVVVVEEFPEVSSPLVLYSDAPVELKLHPPCSIPFFNIPPPAGAAAADAQPKKDWDPSFFLHLNRYDPKKDAESLNPPPPAPPMPLVKKPVVKTSSSTSKSSYTCNKCGRKMAHKWSLQRHQKQDRCTKPSPRKLFESPVAPTLRYVCAFCKYDFNERRVKKYTINFLHDCLH